jgi:hypothetical protein
MSNHPGRDGCHERTVKRGGSSSLTFMAVIHPVLTAAAAVLATAVAWRFASSAAFERRPWTEAFWLPGAPVALPQ